MEHVYRGFVCLSWEGLQKADLQGDVSHPQGIFCSGQYCGLQHVGHIEQYGVPKRTGKRRVCQLERCVCENKRRVREYLAGNPFWSKSNTVSNKFLCLGAS